MLRRSTRTQGRIKMLVLSRKAGEKLVINGNIIVEVLRVQGNRITLGVAAPADVKLVVEDGLLVAC
jgi:carbon storage regulator CsrA